MYSSWKSHFALIGSDGVMRAFASRQWGPVVGEQYIRRIETLQAATEFDDLMSIRSLRLHPLRGDREGEYTLTLHGRWRMILRLDPTNNRLIVQ